MGQYFATLSGHQTDEGNPWLRDITSDGPKSTKCHNGVANVETEVQAEGPGSPEVRAARRGEPLPFDRYNGAQRVASSFERPEAPNGGLRHSIVTIAPNLMLELEVLVAKADLKKED